MLVLQAGAAHDEAPEADAFFLESSDSDSAPDTSSAPLLLSDEGAKQSVSQTQAADPVSTAQARLAASEQTQFQQPKRQFTAGCRPDSNVPSKKPRHSSRIDVPGGAADQHLQQKQQPFVHQQAAGSPQKPPQFLQNGRSSKFAKHSKPTALAVAGVPPRESALDDADLTQNALKQQQGRWKASPALAQVWKMLSMESYFVIEHCRVLDTCEQFDEASLQALVLCMSVQSACPTYEQCVCGVAHQLQLHDTGSSQRH